MKRKYVKPTATMIDYSFDEQVVAESSKFNNYGDGHQINYCTYLSGSFSNPCSTVMNSGTQGFKCNTELWSL